MTAPLLLALDFDGVICNGLVEYFQVSHETHRLLWPQHELQATETLAEQFYRLRPVIETGWEMPVLLEALRQGSKESDLAADWATYRNEIVHAGKVDPRAAAKSLDGVRDRWITEDLSGWLALQTFYPGVVEHLQQLVATGLNLYIISTKEGRFIQQLLKQAAFEFPAERIFGKEVKKPKYQTLRDLQAKWSLATEDIWFVEDRLKTLQAVQAEADLAQMPLFLVDWGYNTASEREEARQTAGIRVLSQTQFGQGFAHWLESAE
ncbi:MAG: HAD family hydrolase [Cyanobacteria bacterium P01_H01_bin.121]